MKLYLNKVYFKVEKVSISVHELYLAQVQYNTYSE